MTDIEAHAGDKYLVNVILDTEADFHVVGNRDLLLDIESVTKAVQTTGGDNLQIYGMGTFVMCMGKYCEISGMRRRLEIQVPTYIMLLSARSICCQPLLWQSTMYSSMAEKEPLRYLVWLICG